MKKHNVILSVLAIFACIILCINFYKGNNALTFTSFLNFIQSTPNVGLSYSISDLTISGDWGILDKIREFLNILTTPLSMILYLAVAIINALVYLFYFLKFIL